MNSNKHETRSFSLFAPLACAALAAVACGSTAGEGEATSGPESLSSCSLAVTANSYDGPNYWGTMTVKNAGASSVTGLVVTFQVPSGAHCTNDAVPSGAVLGPLTGSGSSAKTTSNTCTFTWASKSLGAGSSLTFNYSTDSSSSTAASGVRASSPSCGGTGSSSGSGSGSSSSGSG